MKKYTKENGRKNMRLHGFDYSQSGLYFLTIVVQNRLHLFGHVENGQMILNAAGRMIENCYNEIENKYPDKKCHEMVVMPNHFHCVIENVGMDGKNAHINLGNGNVSELDAIEWDAHVGAPLRGRPKTFIRGCPTSIKNQPSTNDKYGIHNIKYGATIGDVMDWFKTMTTNKYINGVKNEGWRRFDGKLWQRNYYDHIVRNWHDDIRISEYINNNPAKWNDDTFFL